MTSTQSLSDESIGSNLRCARSDRQTGGSSNEVKTIGDSRCQEASKSAKNKGVTSTPTDGSEPSKKPSKVPTDDSTNTIEVTRSDKLDNKLSNKPDSNVAEIIAAWPELPDAIRSRLWRLSERPETSTAGKVVDLGGP